MPSEVTLTFVLDEDVTPDYLALRVAQACSRGALRPGESIRLPSNPEVCLRIVDVPVELPAFLQRPQDPSPAEDDDKWGGPFTDADAYSARGL